MAPHFGTEPRKTVIGTLRRAQLITTFGSGSIADMPNYSVIMASTDYWSSSSPVLHEPNLEKLLGVSCFKQPLVTETEDDKPAPDIPAFRFPTMHFCPQCGRLMPFWAFGDDTGKKCVNCDRNLVPSRFIAACINGHIEDFPYAWWVHRGDFSDCPATQDRDANLKISFSDETGGLEGIIITCSACGKSRSMEGCMGKDALAGYHCRGHRPWIGRKHNDPVPCTARLRGLQRGASNVYFPQTASALTIPPWSDRLSLEVERNWEFISPKLNAGIDRSHLEMLVYGRFVETLQTGMYTIDDIIQAIERFQNNGDEKNYTKKDLYEDEYRVFCLGDYEHSDDFQFRIESCRVPELLEGYLDDIVLVRRLREVLALKGFRRIVPEAPNGEDDQDKRYEGYNRECDFVPLSENRLNWYPGVEMLGEGIFIRFNEQKLDRWEKLNAEFYETMARREEKSNIGCDNFSPRYVLLHTISHLLIRQLSVECGYSGASIKERIYSTYPESTHKMAGILLYTSSSDSDGSLGGLARNALPGMFEKIFRNMLQEASWCSSDPICIESKGQGYDSLNYAACHACTLLPETSCEMRNCLLDRGAVVGSVTNRERGFFGDFFD